MALLRYTILCMLIGIGCTGCFRRWVMTDKEVRKYYANKPVKPTWFTIQNDSATLYCATTGSDTLPPLLMIHGAPGAWYGSRILLDDSILQKHFHLIAVDRPGYHKSRFKGKKKAVTSITTQAQIIHEALRLNRSHKPGVVMGSSYGAPIAGKIALLYPQDFNHLVMLAAAIDPDKEKFWWFHPWIQSGGFPYVFFPRFLKSATDEKFAHAGELQKLAPEWQNLSIPVTVVQGGNDDIIEPANLDYARKVLAGKPANFIYLPDAGHLIRLQRPDVVRSILLNPLPGSTGSTMTR
ncbi:alpha/beta hydrolase [Paraflavitalea sp. CAU 1676]|uniref:alpha/beta fold hydrolase n=1 Tax=Paraflavitalea sp. CAU 1676 TaxID=3032598 RepID=UPI0023DB8087|nr:alpha/beta hydrolase [Paraflavitalea sp. CAU 1676]MDF2193647.1 alpha/beta hydrolase [Paraflavitalea sp. CAU 1676]